MAAWNKNFVVWDTKMADCLLHVQKDGMETVETKNNDLIYQLF